MFSKNLRFLREKNQMEQQELAEKLGRKSSSTISEWEKGKYTPRIGVLNDIAEIFNVSISDLMNQDLSNVVSGKLDKLTHIFQNLDEPKQMKVINYAEHQLEVQNREKVINISDYLIEESHEIYLQSKVSAGKGTLDLEPNHAYQVSYSGKLPRYYDLAFKIDGDSMKPMYEDGEIIFVEKMEYPINGSIMVVQIDDEAFIKKIYIEEDRLRLVSLNPEYEDIYANGENEIRIIGKVVS